MTFQPFTIDHGVEGLRFKICTPEASEWYNPLKPHTLLEYEWVRAYVDFRNRSVIDMGCHHGNYAVVFKGASYVLGVDKVFEFCNYTRENLRLNNLLCSAVLTMTLSKETLSGRKWGIYFDVCKMDIEGDEFEVLPLELEISPYVHTWIVEIHPSRGDPNQLASLFSGYDLMKVDREQMVVRPYKEGEAWPSQATLIARR